MKRQRKQYSGDLKAKIAVEAIKGQRTIRSEEHTSELQSRFDLVCRLLLEKKKKTKKKKIYIKPHYTNISYYTTSLSPIITQRFSTPTPSLSSPPSPVHSLPTTTHTYYHVT